MAVFPTLPRAAHSCVPNVQLEASPGGAPGEMPRATLVALRDIAEGEELTLHYAPSSGGPEQRRAEVRARFFPDVDNDAERWTCSCARCVFDERGAEGAAISLPFALALQEEARYADSEVVLRAWLAANSTHVDVLVAEHAMGVSQLLQGRWAAAHATWHAAAARHPHVRHNGLAKQLAKDAAFAYPLDDAAAPYHTPYHRVAAPLQGGVVPDVFLSDVPIFSADECERMVLAAEAHATMHGWTTARHYSVPTTDVPLQAIPDALRVFNGAMPRIAAMLREQFPTFVGRACVHDAFLVKYDADDPANARCALPEHTDESEVSLTLSLNDAFEGGGTFFPSSSAPCEGLVVRPQRGHCLSFPGGTCRHAGEPIAHGVRYVIAAFLYAGGKV